MTHLFNEKDGTFTLTLTEKELQEIREILDQSGNPKQDYDLVNKWDNLLTNVFVNA